MWSHALFSYILRLLIWKASSEQTAGPACRKSCKHIHVILKINFFSKKTLLKFMFSTETQWWIYISFMSSHE